MEKVRSKESYDIDPKTPSKIVVKDRNKKVKVFMYDCVENIDWIFSKDDVGLEKINKVIESFVQVRELINKNK